MNDPSRVNKSAGNSQRNYEQIVTNTTWNEAVLLKVVLISICGQVSIHALLDEGSMVTILDTEIVNKVGASGPTRALRTHGVSGMCSSDSTSWRVKLSVREDGAVYCIVWRA